MRLLRQWPRCHLLLPAAIKAQIYPVWTIVAATGSLNAFKPHKTVCIHFRLWKDEDKGLESQMQPYYPEWCNISAMWHTATYSDPKLTDLCVISLMTMHWKGSPARQDSCVFMRGAEGRLVGGVGVNVPLKHLVRTRTLHILTWQGNNYQSFLFLLFTPQNNLSSKSIFCFFRYLCVLDCVWIFSILTWHNFINESHSDQINH